MRWDLLFRHGLLIAMLIAPASTGATVGPESESRLIIGYHEAVSGSATGDPLFSGEVVSSNPVLRFAVVSTRDEALTRALAGQDPNVRIIAPDRTAYQLAAPLGSPLPDPSPPPARTPDDPRYPDQYSPQLMRLPEAWYDGLGNHTKGVCIVDTGVRTDHEDLAGNLIGGIDIADPEAALVDPHGHGTHMSGIVAAQVDNGAGIAGAANVALQMVRVLHGGRVYDSELATAIQWCADNGGGVISLSLGAAEGDPFTEDAVRYAHSRGSLVIASAGNGHCSDCINTPARLPEVMAVGCVDRERAACWFESKGDEMELVAPGQDILSTCAAGPDAYCEISGTSMSAPAVAGIAALVWGHRPELSSCEIREVLRRSAQDLGPEGHDPAYGHGLVDAKAAIDRVRTIEHDPAACPPRPAIRRVEPGMGADLRGAVTFRMQVIAEDPPVSLGLTLDGTHLIDLDGPDANDTFEGTYDFTSYGDTIQVVRLDATATMTDGSTILHWSNHTIDNTFRVRLIEPYHRTVQGNVPIRLLADAALSSVESVRFRERGTDWVDITDSFDGEWYRTSWNSTHVDESDPWRYLDIEATDADGNVRAVFRQVEVDNLPPPEVEIIEPVSVLDDRSFAAGKTRIVVRAVSAIDAPLQVALEINGDEPVGMAPHPTLEDHYVHEWDATFAPTGSAFLARATDRGGIAEDHRSVIVIGAGPIGPG